MKQDLVFKAFDQFRADERGWRLKVCVVLGCHPEDSKESLATTEKGVDVFVAKPPRHI